MSQRVLDVEVILVVEDGDRLGLSRGSSIARGRSVVAALGRHGDGRQVDLLGHLGGICGERG